MLQCLGVRDEIPIVSDAAKKHPEDLRATLAAKTPSLSLLSLLSSPGPIEAGGVAEDGTRDVLMAEKDVEAARMPVVEEAENEDEDEDAIIVDFEDAVPEDAGEVE